MNRQGKITYGIEILAGLGGLVLLAARFDINIPRLLFLEFAARIYRAECLLLFLILMAIVFQKHKPSLYAVFRKVDVRRGRVLGLFLAVSALTLILSVIQPAHKSIAETPVVSHATDLNEEEFETNEAEESLTIRQKIKQYLRSRRAAYSKRVVEMYRNYAIYRAIQYYVKGNIAGAEDLFIMADSLYPEKSDESEKLTPDIFKYIRSKRIYSDNQMARFLGARLSPGSALQLYTLQSAAYLRPTESNIQLAERETSRYKDRVERISRDLDYCLAGMPIDQPFDRFDERIIQNSLFATPELSNLGSAQDVVGMCNSGGIDTVRKLSEDDREQILIRFRRRWKPFFDFNPEIVRNARGEERILQRFTLAFGESK